MTDGEEVAMTVTSADMSRHITISKRERELVRLLAQGLSSKEAAAVMGISTGSVDKSANTLRYKLGVKNRREIPMAYWRQTGDDPFPGEETPSD